MQTAVTVFDLLDYYESCERLNISYNKNLGIRGWQACARFIKKVCIVNCICLCNLRISLFFGFYVASISWSLWVRLVPKGPRDCWSRMTLSEQL